MKRPSVALFCAVISFHLMCSLQGGAAQFVEISAEIETFYWSKEETNGAAETKPRIVSVLCVVGTNQWRMESNFLERGEEKWSFDGTNIYKSIRPTRPLPEENGIAKATGLAIVPFERAKSNLTINIWLSRDGQPLANYPINLAWLAFCSGTYLKQQGRLIPLPVTDLRHTRDRFAYTDKTTIFHDEFGLPRTIDLFTSKSLLEASEEDFDKEYFFGDRYGEWKKKIVSNLQEGVRTFHYAVTESTNFLGWNLPVKFEFFQNGRDYEQNGDWFCRGVGRINSIRRAARPESLFVPTMQQTIVDWRLRDEAARVSGNTYAWTNSFVPQTNDPAIQEKFRRRVEQALRRKPGDK
jgi:hypothetical protein